MIIVNYSKAFKALRVYVEQYNSGMDRSMTIKPSMIHTAHELIKIYGAFLTKANGIRKIDRENVPPLKTNNVQLAKLTQSSSRTIQRHIIRLKEAGIIAEKIFHGSNSGYELFINPEILLTSKELTACEAKTLLELKLNPIFQYHENQSVKKEAATKCPHTDTGNNSYKSNNRLRGVDNLSVGSILQSAGYATGNETGDISKRCSAKKRNDLNDVTGNSLIGYTGEKSAKKIEEAGEKVQKRRAGADRADVKTRKEAEARRTSLNFYVKMLWLLARNTLYRDVFLTDKQMEIAQQLLFRWYEPVATAHLSSVHQIYVERIALVRKYIEKDPKRRFVQLPNRYFDPYNPSGFSGTKKWHQMDRKRRQEVQVKLILHAQIRRFLNNEKKEPSKQKPPLQLFRECEQRIGKLRDPSLLEQFHAAVLNPTIHQAVYTH